MTDKQIIIDGVDVHWCEHYTGNIGYLTDKNWTCRAKIQGTKCEDWSNCYFKRWQRKEQECEELKEKVKKYGEINEQETKDYAELKAENDELKEELEELKEENEYNEANAIEFKQTLTEIKEIAETAAKCMYATYSDDYTEGYSWLGRIILQEISEVEE